MLVGAENRGKINFWFAKAVDHVLVMKLKLQKAIPYARHMQQATPYARPSPAIVEYLAFVQTSFGPLDLGSHKTIRNWYYPQQKRQLHFFLSTKFNSILFEHHTCIFYSIVGITM
jgi:hypothetical protein